MEHIQELGKALVPLVLIVLISIIVLAIAHRVLLPKNGVDKDTALPRRLILIVLYIGALVGIALTLPVSDSTRNQVISLIGILVSGVIAFSSTNIVSNVMAGIVLRFTKPFRTGDFIRVNGYFGRVSEKGLFDTEIQTEQRDLIALTNSFLISHPVQVVRSSGTIISASLSLGYDLHHKRIEPLLLKAAEESNLSDPFVQILELGDFSITYQVSGLLTEVKSMISARSKLFSNILDCLHDEKIEIVSPSFMNQRKLPDNQAVLPPKAKRTESAVEKAPEELLFDKAEEAELREKAEQELEAQIVEAELQLKAFEGEEKAAQKLLLESLQESLKQLRSGDIDTTTQGNSDER
ncbi:mechanosensitive ion channel family protein [Glaciecola sp. MH2013]|uniref:mechanosensitive ion channel family protein n=1 Tax=Glaciecola sp. MH2013 TaxID=2785524 RepID=UPI00189F4FDB|nr:mechanosensitive ion channel family protein [Glaciecola sp. MH2013]MBF7074471.1 mechanosensitive ion channel family protein [Glaciecola sp. MH2013]